MLHAPTIMPLTIRASPEAKTREPPILGLSTSKTVSQINFLLYNIDYPRYFIIVTINTLTQLPTAPFVMTWEIWTLNVFSFVPLLLSLS